MGAIDDRPSTRLADIRTAHNYIATGQPIAVTATGAYGYSIKYRKAKLEDAESESPTAGVRT